MARTLKYKLDNFFSSFGAAIKLSDIAKHDRHFIELVCLFASIIDGLLRLTLVMKEQLDSNSDILNERLFFQDINDTKITERTIYKEAFRKKIITKPIHKKLNTLYDQRNRIIHRYVISDIKTLQVLKVAEEYNKMLHILTERHRKYDSRLKKKNIGLAKVFIENPTAEQMANAILKKWGKIQKPMQLTSATSRH